MTVAAPHPSRGVRVCAHCKHVGRKGVMCNHPALPVSVISGQPLTSCDKARSESGPCRMEALLFEPAPAVCSTCNGRGFYRPIFGLRVETCPDCAAAEISAVNATTAAAVTLPGRRA